MKLNVLVQFIIAMLVTGNITIQAFGQEKQPDLASIMKMPFRLGASLLSSTMIQVGIPVP